MAEAFLAPQDRTLPCMLRRQAERFGSAPAVSLGDVRWTHDQIPPLAAARAGALREAGVFAGDRVAIMSPNRPEVLELFLGCGWSGAVLVPINTASQGPQIEYFLKDSQASLLVIDAQYLHRLQGVSWQHLGVGILWVLGDTAEAPAGLPVTACPWPAQGLEVEPAAAAPHDPLAILYTSGTTGPSKGVLCSHAQYYWWGCNTLGVLGLRAGDVLGTTLPLFHINALNTFAQAALVGAEVVYAERFSASGYWEFVRAHRVTVAYLLGAMVPILLAQPVSEAERTQSVRVGLGPGVPPEAAAEFAERTGVTLIEGYGSTETNFVIAAQPGRIGKGAMGWLLPGFEARVADEFDGPVPTGQAGELLLRAEEPFAFSGGYFNRPDKTVEAWRNLWFHTGDRVVCEADGSFRFVDRIKDAIRRRGENISSFEVEQVLLCHPAVAVVAVFPVQSELGEDEVMAALVARSGMTIDPAQLVAWCESRLPYFAIPRYVDVRADLPRTENGKVRKFVLREQGVTASTWERPEIHRGHPKA